MRKYIFILLLIPTILGAQVITGKNQYVILPELGDSISEPVLLDSNSTMICNHNVVLGTPVTEASTQGELLSKIDGKKLPFPPLPAVGQQVLKDKIYQYNGKAVICRQTHNRTSYSPYETPALFSFYRAETGNLTWIPNEQVALNVERTYNSIKYRVIQAHMTQDSWRPDLTIGVLWSVVQTSNVWAVGVAYKVGDEVTYQGSSYRCRQAHTSISTWNPVAAASLWLKL